jgi:glutathione reductase (NADPH)
MSLRGVKFHTAQSPVAVTKSDDGLLSLKTNKETVSGFSHVMFATGRKPNTKVNIILPRHFYLCFMTYM